MIFSNKAYHKLETIPITFNYDSNYMSQILLKNRQSQPQTNLVESIPVKEDLKLSPSIDVFSHPWQEFQGLSWIFIDDSMDDVLSK